MKTLTDMLGENGKVSTTRVLTFFVVIDIMTVWTIMCIQKGEFVEFPTELIGLIGTFLTAKVFQKFGEKNGNKSSVEPKFLTTPSEGA